MGQYPAEGSRKGLTPERGTAMRGAGGLRVGALRCSPSGFNSRLLHQRAWRQAGKSLIRLASGLDSRHVHHLY